VRMGGDPVHASIRVAIIRPPAGSTLQSRSQPCSPASSGAAAGTQTSRPFPVREDNDGGFEAPVRTGPSTGIAVREDVSRRFLARVAKNSGGDFGASDCDL
jgi:hypothetical protein